MTNLPSIFDRRVRRELVAAAVNDLGGMMPPHISIRGNHFALVDAAGMRYPVQTTYIDVLFADINKNKSKVYWGGAPFDPNAQDYTPPVCYSDNGVAPSSQAQTKQARTCVECPHNEWGSAINEKTGGRRKACSDRKKAAVLVLGDSTRLVYQLQIPPASLGELLTYSNKLQSMQAPGTSRKADLDDVVTRVSFVDGKNGELTFTAVAWMSSVEEINEQLQLCVTGGRASVAADGGAAAAAALDRVIDSGMTDDIVGRNDKPWSGAGPAIAAPQATAQPKLSEPAQQFIEHRDGSLTQPSQAAQEWPAQLPGTSQPAAQMSAHGGKRPGSGRKPKVTQEASTPMAVHPPALEPTSSLTSAGMQPETDGISAELRRTTAPKSNSAFAEPQPLEMDIEKSLALAMGLNTSR